MMSFSSSVQETNILISESLFNKSITTIIASIYFSPAVPTHTSIPPPSEVVDFSGIMPNPTYAKVQEGAALKLKEMLGCEKLVAFGDSENDMDLFAAADECYAVANAVPELKERATAVIGANNEDAVAKFLLQRCEK